MVKAHDPIQLSARLTGLSTHVIRIWEQHYQAVEPKRTLTNHRLYSDDDIERLGLWRDVTHAGHNIMGGLGAILVADLVQLGLALDRLRQPAGKTKR